MMKFKNILIAIVIVVIFILINVGIKSHNKKKLSEKFDNYDPNNFKVYNDDNNKSIIALKKGPKGDKGIKGDIGPTGETGEIGNKGITGVPAKCIDHQWNMSHDPSENCLECRDMDFKRLRFKNPSGQWGKFTNLMGAKGDKADYPEYEVYKGSVRFKNSRGWGEWKNLRGIRGPPGDIGAKGAKGEKGPIGPSGEPGEPGIRGPIGDKGPQGLRGSRGDIGVRGLPGEQGAQGPKGYKGATGPRGPPGDDAGFQGPMGDKGLRGALGESGDIGPTGDDGIFILKSNTGSIGGQGTTGIQGSKGIKGKSGPRGIIGMKGIMGPQGALGKIGIKGIKGVRGQLGDKGSQGNRGDKGMQGPMGIIGEDGPKGNKGLRGAPGPVGDIGNPGPAGGLGSVGQVGDPGVNGNPGQKGPPGKSSTTIWNKKCDSTNTNCNLSINKKLLVKKTKVGNQMPQSSHKVDITGNISASNLYTTLNNNNDNRMEWGILDLKNNNDKLTGSSGWDVTKYNKLGKNMVISFKPALKNYPYVNVKSESLTNIIKVTDVNNKSFSLEFSEFSTIHFIAIASQSTNNKIDGPIAPIEDLAIIKNTNPIDFIYHKLSTTRTMLNWVGQYGNIYNSSQPPNWSRNNNSRQILSGITNNTLYTGTYFTRNDIRFINRDGSTDGPDWAIWDFDGANGQSDYDGSGYKYSYFAGENTRGMGGRNNARIGRVWGFNNQKGWVLMYELNTSSTYSHRNTNWYTSGNTTTTGVGKRSEYDNLPITHVGFSVSR